MCGLFSAQCVTWHGLGVLGVCEMNVFKTQMLPCPSGVQSRPEDHDETPILCSTAQSMTVMAFLVARLLAPKPSCLARLPDSHQMTSHREGLRKGGGRMDTQLMRGQCSATKVVFWPGCLPQPRMHSKLQIRSINKGGQLRPTGCNK